MPEIITRGKAPFPVFGGSIPSQKGGRRVNVIAGVDQDGDWHVEKEDAGPELTTDLPILFVPFGGIDYALTMGDLKEMMAGMRESHQRWREKQAPTPDLTKAWKNFAARVLHAQKGRKRFVLQPIERNSDGN